jgi:hypothetical protein
VLATREVDDTMGTIYKRGTRANPRFYFQYRDGRTPDGRRRYTTHAATGARTVEDARKQLALVETRLAQGLPAFAEPPRPNPPEPQSERLGALLTEWRNGLANRSAADDRSRIDRHLIPKFADLTIENITLAVVMRSRARRPNSDELSLGVKLPALVRVPGRRQPRPRRAAETGPARRRRDGGAI